MIARTAVQLEVAKSLGFGYKSESHSMAKFNALDYRQYRPFYPQDTFRGLREELLRRGFVEPFQIADIGCGTGHSAISFFKTGISVSITGVDPDIRMLEQAQAWVSAEKIDSIQFQVGTGEKTGLPTESRDAILVGSAFHWMNPGAAKDEFARVLKPFGVVRIFEYQFPKARNLPELNEWIRRQFNLYWKAPSQKPRGTLTEMTEVFRNDSKFQALTSGKPWMSQVLDSKSLAGLLFSQSRVLCYENTLSGEEKIEFRSSLENELEKRMGIHPVDFDFKMNWFDFGRNSIKSG